MIIFENDGVHPSAMIWRLKYHWRRFWLARSGVRPFGRIAAWLGSVGTSPYHGRIVCAEKCEQGFVAASARVDHPDVRLGKNVLLSDRVVVLAGDAEAGPIEFGDRVLLYGDTFIQSGAGGSLKIGEGTHVQPGCHFRAYVSQIEIGERVEIAAGCSFYCFTHGIDLGEEIMSQELTSKGPISVGDGAWLGHGVTVLEGVEIGPGAVIGAGSIVVKDIPANAIAVGVPAKVIKYRERPSGEKGSD